MFLTQIDLILFFISQTESNDLPHVLTRLNAGIRKFARGCSQTQTPTQKLKSGSSMFSSQEFDVQFDVQFPGIQVRYHLK